MHLKNGDEVVVIAGNHKGKRGKVLGLLKENNFEGQKLQRAFIRLHCRLGQILS